MKKLIALLMIVGFLSACAGYKVPDDTNAQAVAYAAGKGIAIAVNKYAPKADKPLGEAWVNLMTTNAGKDSKEALGEMEKGVIDQLDILFEDIPDANEIGLERWVDLFSIRCRLINYYAPEQVRVDQFLISFMPLVQKDILNLLFGITDTDKRNGKLFKQLIKRNSIQLAKFPLVKGNVTHPFDSSSISARLHSRIKNKLGLSYQSKRLIEFQNS